MNGIAKLLIISGVALIVIGGVLMLVKPVGFPRLPGDIYYRREGFTFYIPLGWCILLSVILTSVSWLFRR